MTIDEKRVFVASLLKLPLNAVKAFGEIVLDSIIQKDKEAKKALLAAKAANKTSKKYLVIDETVHAIIKAVFNRCQTQEKDNESIIKREFNLSPFDCEREYTVDDIKRKISEMFLSLERNSSKKTSKEPAFKRSAENEQLVFDQLVKLINQLNTAVVGTENAVVGTENAVVGTENAVVGTENAVVGTENV